MATATAAKPASCPTTRHEILSTEDRDGTRVYRYRWTNSGLTDVDGKPMKDSGGVDFAEAPIEPLPRAILEDRWAGLTHRRGDASKLLERLDRVLGELQEGVTRRSGDGSTVVDGELVAVDLVADTDGLEGVIREWILEHAAKVAL